MVSYIDLSTGNWNDRKYEISRITIHHAAGKLDHKQFSAILRTGRSVSWNYAISHDGKVGVYVDESHRAWTSSSPDNDHRAVTIEVSNSSNTDPNWPVSSAAYTALIYLCEDICRRNKISQLYYYPNNHNRSNVTLHQWFANTDCPGPYLKARIPDVVSKVNARLKQPNTIPYTTYGSSSALTTYDAAVIGTSSAGLTPENINYAYLNPYIATINRNSPTPNYTKLKALGVSGVLIEAGYLYNSSHKEMSSFKNPLLDKQVEAADAAKLPYGLYATVRANSIDEAKKEMAGLSLWVFRYPPKLGVWLQLELTQSKSVNDSIIKTYQSYLIDWGLKNKIGFYVNSTQLSKITWKTFQNDWFLWLNKHISSVSQINQLMTPEIFDVG